MVIVGSYNWTKAGAYDNDENTLIVHDPALARAYHAEWQRLWDALGVHTLCVSHTVYLPAVMTGIATDSRIRAARRSLTPCGSAMCW